MGRKRKIAPDAPHREQAGWIREALEAAGYGAWTYAQLSGPLKMNESGVGKLLTGMNRPSLETLDLLVKLTNANYEYLATGRGSVQYKLHETIIDISDVPPEKRDAFKGAIKEMIKTVK